MLIANDILVIEPSWYPLNFGDILIKSNLINSVVDLNNAPLTVISIPLILIRPLSWVNVWAFWSISTSKCLLNAVIISTSSVADSWLKETESELKYMATKDPLSKLDTGDIPLACAASYTVISV